MPSQWKVWAVVGRRGPIPHERYIIAIYGHEPGAQAQAGRWRRQYPTGVVEVQSYWVINGQQQGAADA